MSAAHHHDPERTALTRGDLKAMNAKVQTLILDLQKEGFTTRLTNGGVMLYPPDGTDPFRVPRLVRNPTGMFRGIENWAGRQRTRMAQGDIALPEPQHRPTAFNCVQWDGDRSGGVDWGQCPACPPKEPTFDPTPDESGAIGTPPPTLIEKWRPHPTVPNWETNGTVYRCILCIDTEHEYVGPARGIAGHNGMVHGDGVARMQQPEVIEKRIDSRRFNRLHAEVSVIYQMLADALNAESQETIEALRADNVRLRQRAEDAETRLQIIRDGLGL